MARILKKIQQKTSSVEKPAETPPPGKDYILIFLIMLSIMVIGASWEAFDAVMLSMYILLTLSLILTYTRRHGANRLSEFQMMLVTRGSFVTIGMAAALFLIDAYRRYIA
jgi:flagellar protein fliL